MLCGNTHWRLQIGYLEMIVQGEAAKVAMGLEDSMNCLTDQHSNFESWSSPWGWAHFGSSSMCLFISGEVDGIVGGFMLVNMVGLVPLVDQQQRLSQSTQLSSWCFFFNR